MLAFAGALVVAQSSTCSFAVRSRAPAFPGAPTTHKDGSFVKSAKVEVRRLGRSKYCVGTGNDEAAIAQAERQLFHGGSAPQGNPGQMPAAAGAILELSLLL